MSRKAGHAILLRARQVWRAAGAGHLTHDGIRAANRLASTNLARTGKQAGGWDLVLVRQEPQS